MMTSNRGSGGHRSRPAGRLTARSAGAMTAWCVIRISVIRIFFVAVVVFECLRVLPSARLAGTV